MGSHALPDKSLPGPEPERGVCVREGIACYICEQAVGDGERIVLYHDDRFWQQAFAYHASCWTDADLAAKDYGADALIEGKALILPEGRCAGCGGAIGDGMRAVRVAAGGRRRIKLVYHARCFDETSRS
jgi:hypothetical protein